MQQDEWFCLKTIVGIVRLCLRFISSLLPTWTWGGREGDGWLAMRNNGELAAVNFSYVSFTGIYNLKIVVF